MKKKGEIGGDGKDWLGTAEMVGNTGVIHATVSSSGG